MPVTNYSLSLLASKRVAALGADFVIIVAPVAVHVWSMLMCVGRFEEPIQARTRILSCAGLLLKAARTCEFGKFGDPPAPSWARLQPIEETPYLWIGSS